MTWDELKRRIAAEAAQLPLEAEDWNGKAAGPPPAVDPFWSIPASGRLHRHDFLAVPTPLFLRVAYRTILGREPDASGTATYGPIGTCWLGRVAVLGHLAASAEGRRRGVRVDGVRWWRWLHRVASRLPGRRWWLGLADRWLRLLDLPAAQEAQGRANRQWWDRLQRIGDDTAQSRRECFQALEATTRTLDTHLHALESDLRSLEERLERTGEAQTRIQTGLAQVERRLAALLEHPEREAVVTTAEDFDRFYLAFEDACRGPEAEIRAKLEGYLPLLAAVRSKPVADLGCGRGEWLALLQEQGFEAVGVECSPAMIDHCQRRELPVIAADALTWLQEQPENRLGAVTAFHLLEHLPFDRLLALVRAAHRALQPGGVAIFETPNPENLLVGSHTFYHDPTHRNPLTPALLKFVLRHAGFAEVRIERLNPYPPEARVPGDGTLVERVNGHFYGPQDFAAIGIK